MPVVVSMAMGVGDPAVGMDMSVPTREERCDGRDEERCGGDENKSDGLAEERKSKGCADEPLLLSFPLTET